MGSSGQFRSKLDKSFTFDFVNAPIPSELPLSLKRVFKTAYTWVDDKTVDAIRHTADWLLQYMEKNGPYDCVCCFSQSAAILVTLVLDNNFKTPEDRRPLPFKSIVFMNASLEYSIFEDHGLPITQEARDFKLASEKILYAKANDLQNLANIMTLRSRGTADMWKDTSALLHDASVLPPVGNCFGLDLTAFPSEAFLADIPTVHIYGEKDPIWSSGIQLAYLCRAEKQNMYNHQGGHDVPRSPKVADDVAALFRGLAKKIG